MQDHEVFSTFPRLGRIAVTLGFFGLCGAAVIAGQSLIARHVSGARQLGGFWPPFAMAVAGDVALSVTLAFTPQMFALTLSRRKPGNGTSPATTIASRSTPRRLAGE
jgi:hypothetical protein